MSVHKNDQGAGKFQVHKKARGLAAYTIHITSNPKIFPPEFNVAITNKINAVALDIQTSTWTANNIMVKGDNAKELYLERRKYQEQAAVDCNILLSMIDLAWKVFHLTSKRVRYWSEMTIEVRNLIRAWHNSDTKRYSNYR